MVNVLGVCGLVLPHNNVHWNAELRFYTAYTKVR